MSRQRRRGPGQFGDLSRVTIAWLTDAPLPSREEMTTSERWDDFQFKFWEPGQYLAVPAPLDLWLQYKAAILDSWIAECPGTRPTMW